MTMLASISDEVLNTTMGGMGELVISDYRLVNRVDCGFLIGDHHSRFTDRQRFEHRRLTDLQF